MRMKTIATWFKQLFRARGVQIISQSPLSLQYITSYEEYLRHVANMETVYMQRQAAELQLIPDAATFAVNGSCYVCQQPVDFLVDFQYAYQTIAEQRIPNWRERLVCPSCGLNNRLRASIHLFEQECHPTETDNIYITEQVTPLYQWLRKKYENTIGSEYIGNAVILGQENAAGIRNEDMTCLTFPDSAFDHILSFDVFEHIPAYQKAFQECFRCLRSRGHLLFSVPFLRNAPQTLIRARVLPDGKIEHVLPAEYHGNPINEQGSLCFYHFGWDMLDTLREIGFTDVAALLYWAQEFGYLGGEQIVFLASKV